MLGQFQINTETQFSTYATLYPYSSSATDYSRHCCIIFHPRIGHDGPERDLRCSSTFSSISALDGVSDQSHSQTGLSPGKISTGYCTGGWMGSRAGLDRCGKFHRKWIRYRDRNLQLTQHWVLDIHFSFQCFETLMVEAARSSENSVEFC